jgi:hypothetical protein
MQYSNYVGFLTSFEQNHVQTYGVLNFDHRI